MTTIHSSDTSTGPTAIERERDQLRFKNDCRDGDNICMDDALCRFHERDQLRDELATTKERMYQIEHAGHIDCGGWDPESNECECGYLQRNEVGGYIRKTEAENERLRTEVDQLHAQLGEDDVDECARRLRSIYDMRRENERLREEIKDAYFEGHSDNACGQRDEDMDWVASGSFAGLATKPTDSNGGG